MKSILFALFLYIALVWVGGAYLYPGSGADIMQFGLKWTAVGLIVLLLLVVGSRIWHWWRLWQAKQAGRPAAPKKPSEPVHEDDAALEALLDEAAATLAKAPAFAGKRGRATLSGLPLYLLIGPENSGKTSTFTNAGLEAQLLAGRVTGATPVVPTRLCNIWFAKDAIFIEIAGRSFSGDLGRWTALLRGLRGTSSAPLWRRLWAEPERGMTLHGVVGFCEVTDFTGSSNPERLDQSSRAWHERLRAIGEVFGAEFPVYQVITKCDTISFFSDYFKRLPDFEANQVFGCTLPFRAADSQPGTVFAEAEGKRLTKSFNPLYYALAGRRLTHLAHEPDPARRPQIYEFPREFKRIRSPLVEFLNGLSRPDPLRPGPLLRGYYLSGVREVEVAAMVDPAASRADWAPANLASDATQMFRGDATQIFRGGGDAKAQAMGGRGGLSRRWIFVADLFHSVILADRPGRAVAPAEPRIALYRMVAVGVACGLCGLLCFAFLWSWSGNRELLNALPTTSSGQKQDRISQLQSLENLRVQVEKLTDYDRNGAPWGLRWGFYAGGNIVADARKAYFRRFQQLLLNDLNGAMVARLQALPEAPQPNSQYEPANSILKAHLMISSGSCKADPAFAARILKDVRTESLPLSGSETRALADRQIEFYANELAFENPVHVTEDIPARDRARQYLRKITGVEKIYSDIVASAEKNLAKPQRLGDLASNYAQVLSGPGDVSPVFSPQGWAFVQKAIKEGNSATSTDSCVLGDLPGVAGEWKRDAESEKAIQTLYVRDFVDRWKKFLAGLSVTRYAGAGDASKRLDILASHNSPLLALFAMTSNATNFQVTSPVPAALESAPLIGRVITSLKKTEKTAEKAVQAVAPPPSDALTTTSDITRAFQPVQWVVPPGSETWVVEKNTAYIESLAQLRRAMEELARAGANPDPAVGQAADQSRVKAMDTVRQITIGFKSMGVQGIDTEVERLLEEPIVLTKNLIPLPKPTELPGAGANRELRTLCTRVRSLKYPFQPVGDDLSLADLTSVFAPGTGAVWKFQSQHLAEFVVREGQWKAKDPAKPPTPEILAFLNRAQQITDAFFPGGVTAPHFTYTLRPRLDSLFGNSTVELDIDGQTYQWSNSLQHQFSWPALPGAKESGGRARVRGNVSIPFASRGGVWGLFRIMGDAEPRDLNNKTVEWKYLRAGDGRKEPIEPAPVRLEIVEFPGGVDVFNPKFLQGLGCPAKAVP